MPLVATSWWPKLDPIGPASFMAVVVATIVLILAEAPLLRRYQTRVIVIAAILLLACLFVSAAPTLALVPLDFLSLKYRRFPDLDDCIGNWILMTVGLVLSAKLKHRALRALLMVVFGILIAGEFGGQVYWRYAG